MSHPIETIDDINKSKVLTMCFAWYLRPVVLIRTLQLNWICESLHMWEKIQV